MQLDRDPNDMTPDERLRELQEIMARGAVRALLISGTRAHIPGQQALTVSPIHAMNGLPPPAEVNQMISGGMAE